MSDMGNRFCTQCGTELVNGACPKCSQAQQTGNAARFKQFFMNPNEQFVCALGNSLAAVSGLWRFKTMKKILSVILGAAMILSLTACSKQDRPRTGTSAPVANGAVITSVPNETANTSSNGNNFSSDYDEPKPIPVPNIPVTGSGAFSYSYDARVGGIVINDYLGDAQQIHIPSELDGKRVVTVNLSQCYKPITHIVLPDYINGVAVSEGIMLTLKYINIPGNYTEVAVGSFSRFERLESVTIPDSVTSIKERAFSGCEKLANLYIPKSVTSIGARAFSGCGSLKNLTISDEMTAIGDDAFLNCNNIIVAYKGETYDYEHINDLYNAIRYDGNGMKIENGVLLDVYKEITSVEIPNEVTEIGFCAFANCKNLTSITIPDGVTAIGESAFSYCEGLTNVLISDSVTKINRTAFTGCTNLTSATYKGKNYDYDNIELLYDAINLDENGMLIENGVLKDVSETLVGDVQVPNNVTAIGDYAFSNCKGITSIYLPESITEIGSGAFSSCTSLEYAYLPSNVTKISDSAFSGCSNLEWYYIPDGVIEIGDWAFNGCDNLEGIDIPDSVQKIGKHTFTHCENLTSATYKGRTYRYGLIEILYNEINRRW